MPDHLAATLDRLLADALNDPRFGSWGVVGTGPDGSQGGDGYGHLHAVLVGANQSRDRCLRAEKLAALGGLKLITDRDLKPPRLAELMEEALTKPRDSVGPAVNLDGARETASWLEAWLP